MPSWERTKPSWLTQMSLIGMPWHRGLFIVLQGLLIRFCLYVLTLLRKGQAEIVDAAKCDECAAQHSHQRSAQMSKTRPTAPDCVHQLHMQFFSEMEPQK